MSLPTKLILMFTVIALFLVSLLSDHLVELRRDRAFEGVHAEPLHVEDGMSLWGIAECHPVDDASVQDVVSWIRSHNDLATAGVEAGSVILVPVPSIAS